MPGNTPTPALAILGLGPRGISLIERIAAELAAQPRGPLDLHLIEDSVIGAGRIWDPRQPRTLCMNTLAGAVTLFAEPGATVNAPAFEGPTQYEWIRLLRGDHEGIAPAKRATFDTYPPDPQVAEDFAEEIAASQAQSHPSRAFYGAYLRWCYDIALARLPEEVTVTVHNTRLNSIREAEDHDLLILDNGTEITADVTLLAAGWVTPGLNPEEQEVAAAVEKHPGMTWIQPGNPVEQPIGDIPDTGTVLVRGLGMGFFDLIALLSFERGGQFIKDPSARAGLRYLPSGREPKLVVSSLRGYPYLPKSNYGGLPPTPELARLCTVIDSLPTAKLGPASIDFDRQVWPAIIRDSYEAYYRTLHRLRPEAITGTLGELVEIIDRATPENINEKMARFIPEKSERFDLFAWKHPLQEVVGTPKEFTEHIAQRMSCDILEAEAGLDSPLKAGLWAISASRKPAQILGAQGRYTFESRSNHYATLMAIGQMAGSGPPLFRTRQLLALVDAGIVHFLGGDPELRVDEVAGEFVMTSPNTADTPVSAPTLVDAWMHKPDVRRPADPLSISLHEEGRVRSFHETTTDSQRLATGSPEVDVSSGRMIRADQQLDPRLYLVGIPTYSQLPDTTISPIPGTDALLLQETDKAARHALATVFGEM